jgi:hypothetical protein
MHFRFLLSDPQGDIALSPQDLDQPFLLSPEEVHPFLTLKDYFSALQEFIMLDDGKHLRSAFGDQGLLDADNPAAIPEVLIRSEKHGAFYHIASIGISGHEKKGKFAVTTALSGSARTALQEEYGILRKLSALAPDYLPKLLEMETVTLQTDRGVEEFCMVLGEWLAGYHEWHLSDGHAADKQEIRLWDYDNGYRYLSGAQSFELLRQAACILTLYYDQESFCQIYPWHHGAGDFVARCTAETMSVKLITARQYEPLVHFDGAAEADRLVAAIHFLLNLALRMRLDRLDGIGKPAWFEGFAVHAAVAGFFAGLDATAAANRLMLGPAADFLAIMQSFEAREIYDMYDSLLEIYAEEDGDDFHLIRQELADHAAELRQALQNFNLK